MCGYVMVLVLALAPSAVLQGLGKTLESLMLVLANPPPHGWVGDPKTPGFSREEPCPIKTTLLVMPLNLMRQWQQEITTHLTPGALKVGVYDPVGIGVPGGRRGSVEAADEEAMAGEDDGMEAGEGVQLRRSGRRPCPRNTSNDGMGGGQQQLGGGRGKKGGGGGGGGQQVGGGVVVMCRTLDGHEVPMHSCDVCLLSYELLRR